MSPIDRILLVEDDPEMAEIVEQLLGELGFSVQHEADGKAGLEAGLAQPFALVILDVRLPSIDGLEICKRIRAARAAQPILMLTGEGDELSTVLGLELGADEYIAKPFRARELRARVNALLRRSAPRAQATGLAEETSPPAATGGEADSETVVLRSGHLTVNPGLQAAYFEGQKIPLTPTEYRLLYTLMKHQERVLSPDQLALLVLGYESNVDSEASVRSHLSRLRRKLVTAGASADCILNEQGFGYRFVDLNREE